MSIEIHHLYQVKKWRTKREDRSSYEAADVRDGGVAGGAPRVVAVNILGAARGGVAAHGAELRVVERGLLAETAEVGLAAPGLVVAGRAADEAALRVIECGLPVLALGARDVGALLGVDAGQVIDGLARARVCHRAVGRHAADQGADEGGAEHDLSRDGRGSRRRHCTVA